MEPFLKIQNLNSKRRCRSQYICYGHLPNTTSPFLFPGNNSFYFVFADNFISRANYAFSLTVAQKDKGNAPSDATEGSNKRKKHHSSGHKERKAMCPEDESDPLSADPETLSLETWEAVEAFKGAVPYSRYYNDSVFIRRLNVLHTKKWGALVMMENTMTWTYIEFPVGSTAKSVKDGESVFLGSPYITPSKKKSKTPSRESTSAAIKETSSYATPIEKTSSSPEVQVLEHQPTIRKTPSSPIVIQDDEGEG